jgi:hypothetical protein
MLAAPSSQEDSWSSVVFRNPVDPKAIVHLEELGYLFYFNQQSEYTFYKLMF